jgi:uracil-DNA glycosylase
MRVLIVGSNPSVRSQVITPFWKDTRSAKVISSWLTLVAVDFEVLTTTNVYDKPTHNNKPLNALQIKLGLPALKQTYEVGGYTKVVALGKTAAKALSMLDIDFFEMPHPSGRNRKLNDKSYVKEKINGLRDYLTR